MCKGSLHSGNKNDNQYNDQAQTALKPSCKVLYIDHLLDSSFKPYPSEGRRGRIGEKRGFFPREEIERAHLEMREVNIDPMLRSFRTLCSYHRSSHNFDMARQLHVMHFKVAQYLACLELWRVRTKFCFRISCSPFLSNAQHQKTSTLDLE